MYLFSWFFFHFSFVIYYCTEVSTIKDYYNPFQIRNIIILFSSEMNGFIRREIFTSVDLNSKIWTIEWNIDVRLWNNNDFISRVGCACFFHILIFEDIEKFIDRRVGNFNRMKREMSREIFKSWVGAFPYRCIVFRFFYQSMIYRNLKKHIRAVYLGIEWKHVFDDWIEKNLIDD